MSKFSEFNKDRWDKLSSRDKQILISVAINATASIHRGKEINIGEFREYCDSILEYYWQFDELQKPSFTGQSFKKETPKNEPF